MPSYSDFLNQQIGNGLAAWPNVWVGLVSNTTNVAYKSDTVTDSKGKFTFTTKPPGDMYTVHTSLTGSGLPPGGSWTLAGDAAYAVPFVQGDEIGPYLDVTHPSFAGGAKGDAKEATSDDGAITAGTKNFSSASAVFTAADVGKRLVLEGAGQGGLTYADNIAAFVDATHVTMTTNAVTTVSGKHYVYGTDDSAAFIAVAAAAAATTTRGTSTPYAGPRNFLVAAQVSTTVGFMFDGSTIFAGVNTARIFNVTGADATFTGRMTYVGMQLASDCFGGVSQSNTQFFLHANARRCALPLASPGVPSLVAQAGATTMTAGNYTGLCTYVDASGIETGGVGFTLVGLLAGQQILYTASAVPTNVTQVKFYLGSSTGAGATLGLLATVVPVAGSATYTQVSITAGTGGTGIIPGGNATGNVLINMILNVGCRVDGHLWSTDSALVRLEGGRDLESAGIKAGPYTRDPQQYISFIGDIFGTRPAITNASMHDSHVDGGNVVTKSCLVVAQAFGGGNHMRNVKLTNLSVDFTSSLADGVDVVQCDQVSIVNVNVNGAQNGLNISGCTQVTGQGGTGLNCRAAGLQIGDITVKFTTNLVTFADWTSIDCGIGGQTDATACGILIFAPLSSSTNVVTLNNCQSYKSANVLMKYGLGVVNDTGGTFALVSVKGGFLLGNTAAYADASTAAPSVTFKDVGGVDDTYIDFPQVTAAPGPPYSGFMREYATKIAGRALPSFLGSENAAYLMGPALYSPKVIFWQEAPGGNTGNIIGSLAAVGAGTFAAALPTTTNLYTIVKRGTWKTVVTTANQTVGIRMNELGIFLGGSIGQGGFFTHCIFGLEAWTAGNRMFIGLTTSNTPVAGQPSAMTNMVGLGIDAGDTAFTFMHNAAGAATKDAIAGQPALAANQGYAFWMYNPPNSTFVFYRLDNLNTAANIIESVTSTNIPVAATMLQFAATAGNAANAGAAAAGIGVSRFYVDTYF